MNVVWLAYVGAFAVTGSVCLAAIRRALQIDQPAVRRGLVGLLATTGAWALFKVAYFVLPEPFGEPAYTIGLVIGFSTVWAWLYFCSAYTGRSFHHNTTLRRISAALFFGVAAVKLTNPIHGGYFSATETTTPFAHLAIEHGIFHWTATGLSYALAAMGMFMLFELYVESSYDTRPLGVLTLLLGLPVGLDLVALLTPRLIGIIYAPLGVAAFVLGVLFVFERRFLAIQNAGDGDDAVLFLDDQQRIRDYSSPTIELFPELDGQRGEYLSAVLPSVGAIAESDEQILHREKDGTDRYYLVSKSTVSLGESSAQVLLFSDITEAQKRRLELQRHNEQLESFAGALAHELRNMVQIIDGRLKIATEGMDSETREYESVEAATGANERMAELVEDFTSLTRYGQTVDGLESIEFEAEVRNAWVSAETGDLALAVETDGTIQAESRRLQELLDNAFVFARLNDASQVAVRLEDGQFTITDDGRPPMEDIEKYFEFGESVPTAESGMKLPNVRTFARVQGWSVDIDGDYQDGIRLVVSNVTTESVNTNQEPARQA